MACRSFRYVVVFLCAFAMLLEYTTRTNINNAIISMTKEVKVNKTVLASAYCPIKNKGNDSKLEAIRHNSIAQTYDWSPTTQGLILGAFYYGYIVLQVPAGRLAEIFGGKLIVTIGLTASGVITLITPWVADSLPVLITSRVILGLLQGLILPAIFSINNKWMSVEERSLGFGVINVGGNIGAVIASAATGYISQTFGWPYSFFGIGSIAIAWTLTFWLFIVRSQPDPDEESILRNGSSLNTKTVSTTSRPVSVPWVKMLTNRAFLAATLCRFCGAFGSLVLQTKLPAYLEDVLHESVAENGISNSYLFLSIASLQVVGPYISEIVISKSWLSRTSTRKLFAAISQYSLTAAFIIVPFTGCNATLAIVVLVIGMLLYGTSMAGDVIVPAEISQNFSSTIYAIINMLANVPGFVAPLMIGAMLEGAEDGTDIKHRWDRVFFLTAGIVSFGTTAFMIFGSADRQDFDRIEIREEATTDDSSTESECT